MGRWQALALSAALISAFVAHAQSVPPATGTPTPPPVNSASQTSTAPSAQPPQRGSIAPILDIRIQDEGIRLPKSRDETPPAEKPPAK